MNNTELLQGFVCEIMVSKIFLAADAQRLQIFLNYKRAENKTMLLKKDISLEDICYLLKYDAEPPQ